MDQDKIVVFQTFENPIDANIIKSKLDAYGIPCFLTDENLASLYVGIGSHIGSFRVRLHLFSQDIEAATTILNEKSELFVEDDSITRCPHCRSHRIERDFTNKISKNFLSTLIITLFGVFFPRHRIHRCLDCEREFN